MQSHAPALVEQAKTWKFLELWVDPIIFPPKELMLVGDQDGTCCILNPSSNYKLVVTHSNYQNAQEWLLEDEYERVNGQLLAEEILWSMRSMQDAYDFSRSVQNLYFKKLKKQVTIQLEKDVVDYFNRLSEVEHQYW